MTSSNIPLNSQKRYPETECILFRDFSDYNELKKVTFELISLKY